MKIYVLILGLTSLLMADTAQMQSGKWRLVNSGCSNPSYKYSEEELAFIEAIKTEQTIDTYQFEGPFNGIYEVKFALTPNGYCEGRAPFKVVYPKEGEIEIHQEAPEWKFVSLEPNVTVKCYEDGPSTQHYRYRWEGEDLVFFTPSDESCGNYEYFWKKL